MNTEVAIDGTDFLINGRKTYEGRVHEGRRIEGLLMNSRMVQAIFDDANPQTRTRWIYPDTGLWDPQRNTAEFCAMLPHYRAHGLTGITVGLQGGGSIYTPQVFESYLNTGFNPDGSRREAYFDRLGQVLRAADEQGMVVLVNYFYWKQERFENDAALERATAETTDWLLRTGYRNILVDLKNEIREQDGLLSSLGIHRLLDIARSTTLNGRRLIVSTSTHPRNHRPRGEWARHCDFFMPHGNHSLPDDWRAQLRSLKHGPDYVDLPRPVCCNEDSVDIRNLDSSIDEGCSWGYYDQGYGCDETQRKFDWAAQPRESHFEQLSGFQTVPVNWGINTPHKRAFFTRLKQVTVA